MEISELSVTLYNAGETQEVINAHYKTRVSVADHQMNYNWVVVYEFIIVCLGSDKVLDVALD